MTQRHFTTQRAEILISSRAAWFRASFELNLLRFNCDDALYHSLGISALVSIIVLYAIGLCRRNRYDEVR